MNTKKFLLSALAGFVANVVTYFILEELLLKNYMEQSYYQAIGASSQASPLLPLIAVLIMALIMAYAYPKGYQGGSPFGEGIRFGLVFGLFLAVPFSLFTGAQFTLGGGVILVLIIVSLLEILAAGLVIGLVYGRLEPSH